MLRRTFVKSLAAAGAAGLAANSTWAAELPADNFGLEAIGKVAPRGPLAITASPLGVGFETLDRKHFDPEKTLPHLEKLGAKWARCQTGWCRCETEKGKYTFEWLDAIVDALRKRGIQPWFNLGYGNKLYTPDAPDEAAVGWAPLFQEETLAAWLKFTEALGRHFADRVTHWEIWNEPNIKGFWKPQNPNAADYVKLVKATVPVVRRAVPKAVIIGGGYAGIPLGYIEDCFKAGMGEHIDKLSYHPYRPVPESKYNDEIGKLRAIIAAHKPGTAIWQGENGCPSKGGPGTHGALSNLEWNETRQAKWVLRRVLCDLRLEVELSSYFHTIDLVGYRGGVNYKGLLHGTTYEPKESFYAYQVLCALFDSQTKHVAESEIELVNQEKRQMTDAVFVRGGRPIYAWWAAANLQEPFEPKQVTLRLPVVKDAKLAEPVLVDPLRNRVLRLPAGKASGGLVFADLPLLDYPLLLTDKSVVA